VADPGILGSGVRITLGVPSSISIPVLRSITSSPIDEIDEQDVDAFLVNLRDLLIPDDQLK
jgi:hypothetical protein